MTISGGPVGSSPISGTASLALGSIAVLGTGTVTEAPARIQVATFLERRLVEHFHQNPEALRTMDRRQFEELVAEIFSGFGYDVELTARSRDGGKDVIAIKRQEVDLRLLIQCKRPDPGNAIEVATVRELLGVHSDDPATKSILATTTRFTRGARELIERHRWQLEGRDYVGVCEWVGRYFKINAGA